jgi:dipeptidyl aminopeptidase/acylaminoacyl peptidase
MPCPTVVRMLPSIVACLILAGCDTRIGPASSRMENPTMSFSSSLIPREILFGNPDKASLRVSPDGRHVAFLAPLNGVLNVWVAPAERPEAAQPVTRDSGRGIQIYFWAYTNQHILYLQDDGGDENWKVHAVDLATGASRDLTPFDTIPGPDGQPIRLPDGKPLRPAAHIENVSHRFTDSVLVGLNTRDPRYHDLYRLDIRTGALALVQQNPEFADFVTDDDYQVRFATRVTKDGGTEIVKAAGPPAGPEGIREWAPYQSVNMEDALTTYPLGFDRSGRVLYMKDSRGRDTAAVTAVRLDAGATEVLAADPRADASAVLAHPTEGTIQAVAFNYTRTEWTVLDPAVKADLDFLKTVAPGDVIITSRTLDDRTWTVAFLLDNGPARSYLYDRAAKRATFLFTNRKAMEGLPLARMQPVVIPSRDGLNLVSYLTLPREADPDGDGRPRQAVPLVLSVHGGPWARDSWGLDPEHQWLANRGYAVLSVNFRGSTGFGKRFVNAGNREWAAKMHDDLLDGVDWAVRQGIARRDRVCVMGASYGGYATLVGLTFTPTVFACGVDIVGPSNLITLLNTIPPYWEPGIAQFTARVGDHRTEDGRRFLENRSPLTFADRIQRPLLIGQGANDPRVKQSEADQIVAAMQKKGISVTYVLYPDEGHGFVRPENRLSFNAVVEAFLSRHLGGRFEHVGGDFRGSTITVPSGADGVPGLVQALAAR